MISFARQKILDRPWFSWLIKWFVMLWLVTSFFTAFIMQPLYIKKVFLDRTVIPINDTFYINTISYKPWFSTTFCEATDAKLHMKVKTVNGYTLTLDPINEPYGYNNTSTVKRYTVRHKLPINVQVGETIYVKKVVKYDCSMLLFWTLAKTVQSGEAEFMIGPSSDNLKRLNPPTPLPSGRQPEFRRGEPVQSQILR